MSHFNSPEEVQAHCAKAAADDLRRHREFNVDLNPFSTAGARNAWQRGFDGVGPRSYETTNDYDTIYHRGAHAARLLREGSEIAPVSK